MAALVRMLLHPFNAFFPSPQYSITACAQGLALYLELRPRLLELLQAAAGNDAIRTQILAELWRGDVEDLR